MAILQPPLQDEEREKGAIALGTMVRFHIQLIAYNVYYDQERNAKQSKNIQAGRSCIFMDWKSLYTIWTSYPNLNNEMRLMLEEMKDDEIVS